MAIMIRYQTAFFTGLRARSLYESMLIILFLKSIRKPKLSPPISLKE
jgi:hypothetical protein